MAAGSESTRDPTEFRLRDAAFSVQARLRAPLWNLVQDMPAICSCVLERLAPFGVGLNDLRIDNRDGNLGEANLGFWALDLHARCNIRLADVEVHCQELSQVEVRQIGQLTQALLGSVLDGQPDAAFADYQATFRMHGVPGTSSPATFLQQFTNSEPKGLGPVTGSGATFHFGPSGRRTSCAISADMSSSFTDSIYLATRVVFDADQLQKEDLMAEAGRYLNASLGALGLTLPATGESK